MARIGVFGGTFDPPHLGHMILAAEAADQLALDTVLWMAAPLPPHKADRATTPFQQRTELVRAAISGEPRFEVSTIENERPGPHYTADTLEILRAKYSGDELFCLIGQDSLNDLFGWYEPDRIVAAIDGLGVMARPGERSETDALFARFPALTEKLLPVDAPLLEISSTEIRARVRAGRHYRYYVRDSVAARIEAWRLYR